MSRLRERVKKFFERVDDEELTLKDICEGGYWPSGAWQLVGARRQTPKPQVYRRQAPAQKRQKAWVSNYTKFARNPDTYQRLGWRWWATRSHDKDGLRYRSRRSHLTHWWRGSWVTVCGREIENYDGAKVNDGRSPAGICGHCTRRAEHLEWPMP